MPQCPQKAIAFLSLVCLLPNVVFALPQGAVVAEGSASLAATPNQLTVTQTSDKAILQYDSFSIGNTETVNFVQPSSSSIALNRVTGSDPSQILGNLNANGKIFLINPNGVVFGSGATVDTAGLVASTINITNSDFMAGNFQFSGNGGGSVINAGTLKAPGSFVALLGSHVENNGAIEADLGSVALAAGDAVTLNLDPSGLISVVINTPVSSVDHPSDAAVVNRGQITSKGGKVLLTAGILANIFDQAVNNEGIIEATTLSGQDGEIVLSANGDISVGGTLNGGSVTIDSSDGNVTHASGGAVNTFGSDFTGVAAGNYTFQGGSQVDSGPGDISITANQITFDPEDNTVPYRRFTWNYVSDSRNFHFKEFGYYFLNSNNQLVFVPLSIGQDIGHDGTTPLSGSGIIYGEAPLNLYTVFSRPGQGYIWPSDTSGLTEWTFFSEAFRNQDGANHLQVTGNRYGWEDVFGLGDFDFNDAVLDFAVEQIIPSVQTTLVSRTVDVNTPQGNPSAPVPVNNALNALVNVADQDYRRAYYEILDPSRLVPFEPVRNVGLYFYHPLTPTDSAAFEQLDLDLKAFDFIDQNIERKEKQSPYLGL